MQSGYGSIAMMILSIIIAHNKRHQDSLHKISNVTARDLTVKGT